MAVSRRRLFQSLVFTGGSGTLARGAEQPIALDVLRNVSGAHGSNLSDDRLRIAEPVIRQRGARLQALRRFEVDDSVGLTQGILK